MLLPEYGQRVGLSRSVRDLILFGTEKADKIACKLHIVLDKQELRHNAGLL